MSTIATLTTRYVGDTRGFDSAVRRVRASVAATEGTFGKFSAGTRIASAAVAAGLVKIGLDFQSASNTIRRETGATGRNLDGLNASLRRVYATRPESLNQVAEAISVIHRQSGATGPALEGLARTSLRLASITREDLGRVLSSTQDLMRNWGVAAADQIPKLDVLYRTHQQTGISVTKLSDAMTSQGTILRQLGLSYDESAALIGILAKSGLDVTAIQMGLNRALVNAAKAGVPARDMFRQLFDTIRTAPSETAAAGVAVDAFGARAGPRLAGLIREGKLSFDDLSRTIAGGSDTIDQAARDTATASGRMKIAWHSLQVAVEPIASTMVEALTWLSQGFMRLAQDMGPVFPVLVGGLLAIGAALWVINANPIVAFVTAVVVAFIALRQLTGSIQLALLALAGALAVVTVAMFLLSSVPLVLTITLIVVAIAALVAGIIWLAQNWDAVWSGMQGIATAVWGAIAAAWNAAWGGIQAGFEAMIGFLTSLPGRFLAALADAGSWLLTAGRNIVQGLLNGARWAFLNIFIPWVLLWPLRVAAAVATAILWLVLAGKNIVRGLVNGLIAAWPAVAAWFSALPGRVRAFFANALQWLGNAGRNVLHGFLNGITAAYTAVAAWFGALPGRVRAFGAGALQWLQNAGGNVLRGFLNGITGHWGAIGSWFGGLGGRIKAFAAGAGQWLVDAGRAVIQGFLNGMKSLGDKVKDTAGDILKSPVSLGKKILGIKSPSTVFYDLGVDTMTGYVQGVEAVAPDVAAAVAGALPTPAAPTVAAAPAAPAVTGPAGAAAPDATPLAAFQASAETSYAGAADAAATWTTAVQDAGTTQQVALASAQTTLDAFAASQLLTWANLAAGIRTIAAALAAALATTYTNSTTQLRAILAAFNAWTRATWAALAAWMNLTASNMSGRLVATYQSLSATLRNIVNALSASIRGTWAAMAAAVSATAANMSGRVVQTWRSMAAAIRQISDGMLAHFRSVMGAMASAGTTGGINTGNNLRSRLSDAVPPITTIVRNYARAIRDALNPILTGIGEKKKISLPFATGGRVPGTPGGGDRVPAVLTAGEFVIPARAASQLGANTLEQLRRGWLPLTSQAHGYAEGGQVLGVQRPYPNLTGDTDFLPALGNALSQLASATVGAIFVTSGYRSIAEQAALFARNPNPMMVAAPGKSRHGQGVAADISPQRPSYRNQEGRFGLRFPMSWEPWHIELAGGAKGLAAAVSAAIQLKEVPEVKTGGEWLGGTAQAAMTYLRKVAQAWADKNTVQVGAGWSGGAAPPGQVRGWIMSALKIGNWPAGWAGALYARVMQESGGNPRAVNNWDSNARAGTPSKGLVQTIDPTFQSYKMPGYDDIWNPVHNLLAGIRYMIARYGSPLNLPSGGYANGGIVSAIAGGRNILAGEGGRDEAVIPLPGGWRNIFAGGRDSLSPAGSRSAPAVHIEHYEVREDADATRLFAMARFQQRAGRI